jgi:hypothetical protein
MAGGYTGKLLERELLGVVPKKPEILRLINNKNISLWESLDVIKKHSEGDPSDPDKRFPNDLHATIADKLELDDYSSLRYYTTVDSAVDRRGIDAIFDLENNGKILTVTVDLTMNPNKDQHKADVIILSPNDGLDPVLDKELYQEVLEKAAKEIIDRFNYLKEKRYGRKQR